MEMGRLMKESWLMEMGWLMEMEWIMEMEWLTEIEWLIAFVMTDGDGMAHWKCVGSMRCDDSM